MNNRVTNIVEQLLDLSEDLNSKLEQLTKQFPNFTEQDIRQMALADPTHNPNPSTVNPDVAAYVTWLLRMRKGGAWDGNPETVRPMLASFEEIRRVGWGDFTGKKDINQYKTLDELSADLESNKLAGSKKQRAEKGVSVVTQNGDLKLLQLLTADACRKFAIGHGTTTLPETVWCTIAIETAKGYLAKGPIHVTMKGGHPYVQTLITKDRHTDQCKTIKNADIPLAVAAEIAPLYKGLTELFSNYQYKETGWVITDRHVESQLSRLISRHYTEQLKGYAHSSTGAWVPPAATTPQEARASMLKKLSSPKDEAGNPKLSKKTGLPLLGYFDVFRKAIAENDEKILRMLGERETVVAGMQALFNAVYELENTQHTELPKLLTDYNAFIAAFEQMATDYEHRNYRG